MTSNEWVASKIKALCQDNNISINKLALSACITQSTLNSIVQGESKNPKISTLAKISNVLDLHFLNFLKALKEKVIFWDNLFLACTTHPTILFTF